MWVRRLSEYLSLTFLSSDTTISRTFVCDRNRDCSSSMLLIRSLHSSFSMFRCSCANCLSGMSRIELACVLLRSCCLISALRAAGTSLDLRISFMTASILSSAVNKPDTICALSFACLRSNCDRLRTTSIRCSKNTRNACLRVKSLGSPLTSANKIMLKVVCNGVSLNNCCNVVSGSADLLRSMTIRIPCRSDSSLRSVMPVIRLSRASPAIRLINDALLV